MKTICAWCGSTIAVNCDHCGAPLLPTNLAHSTFFDVLTHSDDMVCLNGMTPVIYSSAAIQRMPATCGLCKNCAALPTAEREAMLTQRRLADPRLPSAADLDAIWAERELAEKHEQATRRAARAAGLLDPAEKAELTHVHQKRGPTEVTRRATGRAPADDKKGTHR